MVTESDPVAGRFEEAGTAPRIEMDEAGSQEMTRVKLDRENSVVNTADKLLVVPGTVRPLAEVCEIQMLASVPVDPPRTHTLNPRISLVPTKETLTAPVPGKLPPPPTLVATAGPPKVNAWDKVPG